jgi:hypothetical protein
MQFPRLLPGDDRYLSVNERTVLVTRLHIIVLIVPGFQTIAAIVLVGLVSPAAGTPQITNILTFVALFMLLRLAWKVLDWYNVQIIITDKRIFKMSGLITREVATMPLRMMTDMTYQRTAPGRILGYGTLIVESAGQDQALSTINYLPQPDEMYRTITGLIFK